MAYNDEVEDLVDETRDANAKSHNVKLLFRKIGELRTYVAANNLEDLITSVGENFVVSASYSNSSSAKYGSCKYKKIHEHVSYDQLDNNTWVVAYHQFFEIFKHDMNLHDTLIRIAKYSSELDMK